MRISWCDEETYPGKFELWHANCERSIKGKLGQKELRELRDALVALPEKRLVQGALEADGEVCSIGAYGRHKGLDLSQFDVEYDSDEVGIAGGMPRLVAWKVVEMNDVEFERCTPEDRYQRMLAWVESKLTRQAEEG